MGFVLAMVILWLVFRHLRGLPWSRRACLGPMYRGPGRWQSGAWRRRPHPLPVLAERWSPPRREERREGALEGLKRRYVAGELSDEQYEQELDTLFRTTSGRRQA